MRHDWDEAKRRLNLAKHGVDFADIVRFTWASALVEADVRVDYGEIRLNAIGVMDDMIYVIVFTIRRTSLRLISFRRASRREILRYVTEIQNADG